MVEKRSELKGWYQSLSVEHAFRTKSPVSGPWKGKGCKGQCQQVPYENYRDWPDEGVRAELQRVTAELDNITYLMQEGKLMSGEVLSRPYRMRPMFVEVLLTASGGMTWIMQGSC